MIETINEVFLQEVIMASVKENKEVFILQERLKPIVKWAGGKEKELKYILPNLPKHINNYYEPFIGGGAVYGALITHKMYINDRSDELINLYRTIASNDNEHFKTALKKIINNWENLEAIVEVNQVYFLTLYQDFSNNQLDIIELKKKISNFILNYTGVFQAQFQDFFSYQVDDFKKELYINLFRKIKRMKKIEKEKGILPKKDILENIETAFKSALYMSIRDIYNFQQKYNITTQESAAIFLFIRNYAYSGMFRYNANGKFNVPYGGIGYNRKDFGKKIKYLESSPLKKHLSKTIIENLDFEDFLRKHPPQKNDFIFLDPPYDSEFSTYAQNDFSKIDQQRLANYLINDCPAHWMMVIKNTDFIFNLYQNKGLYIKSFDKKYLVSFMNRNDKMAKHLMITNY